jgi:DNA invertase Pin-like site-specific DNA recombinase
MPIQQFKPTTIPPNRVRRAVLYARVSSKEQELGYSILAQQELLRSYGAQLNVTIESFSDVETAKTVGRPGFNEMVSYLRKETPCSSRWLLM